MKHTVSFILILSMLFALVACSAPSTPAEMQTPHTHSFGDWVVTKNATCTGAGQQERSCSCGEKQTQSIAATGHSFGEWKTVKAATCTEDGQQERVCSCGEKQTQSIAATGHSFGEWITTKTATCAKEGSKTRECANCGITETENIEKTTEHNYIDFKCTICGKTCIALNEIGKSYIDKNGLTVTLNTYTVQEYDGYFTYAISYTIVNNVPDSKLMPGTFKLFFTDDTGENQYGGFNYLFYGEQSKRSYSWKVLKNQTVLVLEYNADDSGSGLNGAFFRNTPAEDSMHWLTPVSN